VGANEKVAATFHGGNTDPRATPITREYGHGAIRLTAYPSSQRVCVETSGTNPVMDAHEFLEFADLIEGAAGYVRVRVDDETVERVARALMNSQRERYGLRPRKGDAIFSEAATADARAVLAALRGES
jgi:hypothetical protein